MGSYHKCLCEAVLTCSYNIIFLVTLKFHHAGSKLFSLQVVISGLVQFQDKHGNECLIIKVIIGNYSNGTCAIMYIFTCHNTTQFRSNKLFPHYLLEESSFSFRSVSLCDLDIPRENSLNYLQTVENSLILVCTICNYPFGGLQTKIRVKITDCT